MWRAVARACVGYPGWKDDLEQGVAMCRIFTPIGYPVLLLNKYSCIATGALLPDETTLRETAEALELAERFGEDVTWSAPAPFVAWSWCGSRVGSDGTASSFSPERVKLLCRSDQ